MIPVTRIYLLYLQTVLIIAGPGSRAWESQFRMQVSNTLTVYVIFCPSTAILGDLKHISCNINEPKQYNNRWQKLQVSISTKRHAEISGNHADV